MDTSKRRETLVTRLGKVKNLINSGKDLEIEVHFSSFLLLGLTNIVRE